jgi:hypothetical protein
MFLKNRRTTMTNETPAHYGDLQTLDPVRLDQICDRAFEAVGLCMVAARGMIEQDRNDVAGVFEILRRICEEIAIACDEEILKPAHPKTTHEKVGAA